jgi:hypothetical protein
MRRLSRWARWFLPAAALVLASVSCGERPAVSHPAAGNPAAGNPAAGNPAAGSPAAGHPAPPPASITLAFGVVQASPGCPVQRAGHACPPRPLPGVLVQARSLPGGVIASTRTRAGGHYSLRLRPGDYVLAAVTRQVLPRCPRVRIAVTTSAPVRANINCDSGIR